MSNFKPFLHVRRLDAPDVEGILDKPVWLSYKLDGTNSSLWFDKDTKEVRAGSRNRELTLEKDNAGFYAWSQSDDSEAIFLRYLLSVYPHLIIYGEWLGTEKFIGNIKTYNKDSLNKLWIFAIYDSSMNRYMNSIDWRDFLNRVWNEYNNSPEPFEWMIPATYMENPTEEKIIEFAENNQYLLPSSSIGEGIVIVQDNYINKYGRFEIAKYVRPQYQRDKTISKKMIPIGDTEKEIVLYCITDAELSKTKAKLELEWGEEFSNTNKHIGIFMNRVWNDTIIDEMKTILKKWKMPTIDFRTLKRLSDETCRNFLKL